MKKDLYDILGDVSLEEMDALLRDLPAEEPDEAAAEHIREKALAKAEIPVSSGKKRSPLRRAAAVAACLALAAAAIFGTQVYATEVRTYEAAVVFFRDNQLDDTGLTRRELKAVYRDITTASFSLDTTAEVIQRSLRTDRVESYDIFQSEPDPADVEALWNYRCAMVLSETAQDWYQPPATNVRYETDKNWNGIFRRSVVRRYEGEERVWSVTFTDFGGDIACCPLEDGVLVWGTTPDMQYVDNILVRNDQRWAYLAKVSQEGELLWQLRLENGADAERAQYAVDNGDGTYAFFTTAWDASDKPWLCLTQVDGTGQVLSEAQVCECAGFFTANQAVKMGDGYLISTLFHDDMGHLPLIQVSRDGRLMDIQELQSEGRRYLVTKMLSYGGRIYLSARAVPESGESWPYDALHERIRAYPVEGEVPKDVLTEMAREYFSAALLVLDENDQTPIEVYAIRGSSGWSLAVDDEGQMIWDVERIDAAVVRPEMEDVISVDHFFCAGRVFRYTFGPDGFLKRQEDTGLQSSFGVMLEFMEPPGLDIHLT